MNLVERVKNILLNPVSEWNAIKGEQTSPAELFTKYALILAAIPAVAGLIGFGLIGTSVAGISIRYPFGKAILWAALNYGLGLAIMYVLAIIVDALAPSFGAAKNMTDSLKVVVFSHTAAWVGGVFMLLPSLSPLALLASIYSLVLLYFGLKIVKAPPAEKAVGYFIVVIVVTIVLFAILSQVLQRLAFGGTTSLVNVGM